MLERVKRYIQSPVFLFILWMGVALFCSLSLMPKGTYSNYVIFSQSFWPYLLLLCILSISMSRKTFFSMVSHLRH